MRFDDMLTTLLAQPHDSEDSRVALWRQLVDLMAQGRFNAADAPGHRAFDLIAQLRSSIPPSIRYETARAFTGLPVSAATIALFADEPASIVAPLIAEADLGKEEWLALLPTLTPTARTLMRHRRDLPGEVNRALESFGASDFVIPNGADQGVAQPAGAVDEIAEIAEVMAVEEFEADEVAEAADFAEVEDAEVEDVGVDDAAVDDAEVEAVEPVASVEEVRPAAPAISQAEEPAAQAPVADEGEDTEFQYAFDEIARVAESTPPDSASVASHAEVDGGEQIRELMARIEAYRAHDFVRPAGDRGPAYDDGYGDLFNDEGFRFETGADGVIRWVAGASRGPLIGETIAVSAGEAGHGVDGSVAGAFRQRAPFRDARMTLNGDSPLSGEWRISAVPLFDPVDGRFNGYRGTARRPRVDEVATPLSGLAGFAKTADADSLRQLVHELRTPLNAIIGFSEMIEGQFLGPASTHYRAKASDIITQGRRLLEALEDLDLSARLEPEAGFASSIDPVALLERLHDEYQSIADDRGFHLRVRVGTGLGVVAAEPVAVERVFGRLLAATLAIAQRGETVTVTLDHDPETHDRMMLSIQRPGMIQGRDERTLLDPGYNPDGDWPEAPVLGLGFALRLVRNIAAASGGALDIQPEALILRLPLRKLSARTRQR